MSASEQGRTRQTGGAINFHLIKIEVGGKGKVCQWDRTADHVQLQYCTSSVYLSRTLNRPLQVNSKVDVLIDAQAEH